MLKTGDFATRCGVSKRHIDRLLKRHEEDLSGHFERREAGGTFLDEYAQDFLRSKLRNPMEILPAEEELDPKALKAELDELRRQLTVASVSLADAERRAGQNAGAAALLEASDGEKKRLQKEKDELLKLNGSQEAQISRLSDDNEVLEGKYAQSQKDLSEAQEKAKKLEDDNHLLKQQLNRRLSFWERITGRRKKDGGTEEH